jgi:hypothetical protein
MVAEIFHDFGELPRSFPFERLTIRSGPNKQGTTRWTMQHAGGPRYLLVEAGAKVLVLEDSAEHCERFLSCLPDCVICRTVREAIEAFDGERFDFCFIDRDLGGPEAGYGEDFAKHLAAVRYFGQVIVHSANLVVARYMDRVLRDAGVRVEMIPFTILGVFQENQGNI